MFRKDTPVLNSTEPESFKQRVIPYLQTAVMIFVLTAVFSMAREYFAPEQAAPQLSAEQREAIEFCKSRQSVDTPAAKIYDEIAACLAESGAF